MTVISETPVGRRVLIVRINGGISEEKVLVDNPSSGFYFFWCEDPMEEFPGAVRPPWAVLHEGKRFVPWFQVDPTGYWAPTGDEYPVPERESLLKSVVDWVNRQHEV